MTLRCRHHRRLPCTAYTLLLCGLADTPIPLAAPVIPPPELQDWESRESWSHALARLGTWYDCYDLGTAQRTEKSVYCVLVLFRAWSAHKGEPCCWHAARDVTQQMQCILQSFRLHRLQNEGPPLLQLSWLADQAEQNWPWPALRCCGHAPTGRFNITSYQTCIANRSQDGSQ